MISAEEQQRAIDLHIIPLHGLEKAKVESIESGKVCLSIVLDENMMNYKGTVHGGFLTMIGDAVFGLTTYLHDGKPSVTVNMDFHFISPSYVGDKLFYNCETIHKGRSTVINKLNVTNQDSKLIAYACATMMPLTDTH